jgi:D-lactate dehydrogenase (cytochrome)
MIWVPIRISMARSCMRWTSALAAAGLCTVSLAMISIRASGNRAATSSASRSTPGPQAANEPTASQLEHASEAVPATVNALVAAARAIDPGIEKTAGDMVVPFDRLADSLALYREVFVRRGLDHAIWGHISDGNLHPNVLPRSMDDVERGREAILEIARAIVSMGGAPLAEHGVGRSTVKQRLLRELYGDEGIEQMRAVKRALDPEWKLAPGVIFASP